MRLEEEFVGRRLQYAELLKRVASQLEADNLLVRGKKIELPDEDMEYKISQSMDEMMNDLDIGKPLMAENYPHLQISEVEVIQGGQIKTVWKVETSAGTFC